MTPAALALVLTAAICHAAWNLVAKKAGGGRHFVLIGSLQVAVVWLPVVAWVGVRQRSTAEFRGRADRLAHAPQHLRQRVDGGGQRNEITPASH